MTRVDVRERTCSSKKAYPTPGLAAVAAQEFMLIHADIPLMSAYRCPFCGDWHISRQVRGASSINILVIERDPTILRRRDVERNRKQRRLRVMLERERQARQRFIGDEE